MRSSILGLVFFAMLGVMAGCSPDKTPTAPTAPPSASLIGMLTGDLADLRLLDCDALPFKSDEQVIGPEGGTLRFGPHSLSIPPGALSRPTLISGRTSDRNRVEIKFGPEGLRFRIPATLTLRYGHCGVLPAGSLRVVYVGDNDQILELPQSKDDKSARTVEALIEHFSDYVVAY
jgi:hypothetical protein